VAANFMDALACLQSRDLERADALCAQLVREQPAHFDSWHLWGLVAFERRQLEQAVERFRRSLELNPGQAAVLANLGHMLVQLNRGGEALDCFERAAKLDPNSAAMLYGFGCALLQLKRAREAIAILDRALQLQPNLALALNVRGHALQSLQRFEEALQSYDRSITLQPDLAVTHHQRGLVLVDLQQPRAALASFDQAVRLAPALAEAHQGRGIALTRLQQPEEASKAYARCLELRGDLPYMRGQALHALLQQVEWSRREELSTAILAANARGEATDEPFSFLSVSGSAEAQLSCARRYIADWYPPREPPLWDGQTYTHEKIRVAYLSADFGEHPVSYLMAGVFERHDRGLLETAGLSLRPVDARGYGARTRQSFDHFVEIGSRSDADIARFIRDAQIDILVDLMGFTRGARLAVLSYRAAPVQVSYLGYPGTMGAPYIDYLLGDRFVIPPQYRCHYTEAVAYLPDCFQANDAARALPEPPSRGEAGLPESGFVFCSFNASYKITPEIFDIWCRLLNATAGSILWLLGDREATRKNLQREARNRGVAPERLVFAERAGYANHLARLRLADLFLDTPVFNAGTSASDALWAQVPVLTCPGEAFASRMAGSLLQTIGLPELICQDLQDYEQRALDIARNSYELRGLRERLRDRRVSSPLFDTVRFCGHLERAYLEMHQRARRGEKPSDFAIPC
jgi:predicted O-linked N-acetylglucosamine transferase (SPINDLY family)